MIARSEIDDDDDDDDDMCVCVCVCVTNESTACTNVWCFQVLVTSHQTARRPTHKTSSPVLNFTIYGQVRISKQTKSVTSIYYTT